MKGFEVYIAEVIDSVEICSARNIHHRTRQEIEKVRKVYILSCTYGYSGPL